MKDTETQEQEKLKARRKRCETARMWMIVLASVLLLGGYLTALLPVMYASVLPLVIAGALTYGIKSLERKIDDD